MVEESVEGEDVDKDIVVRLDDVLGSFAVLPDPVHGRQRLVAQVPVGVHEVGHNYVVVCHALLSQLVVERNLSGLTDYKDHLQASEGIAVFEQN